jgi:hypothetical protein
MAANSVVILTELVDNLPFGDRAEALKARYIHALGFAKGMDELSLDDWRGLRDRLEVYPEPVDEKVATDWGGFRPAYHNAPDLATFAKAVLAVQTAEWVRLGEPSCAEAWGRAKYGCD